MSTNETPSVAEIVANPELYGFEWITEKVSKGDATWTVPLVRHTDVDKLRATFGDSFFIASMDGTSRHVTNQRIARDAKADNATIKDLAIKTAIVENMLGMKSKRRTVVETIVYEWNGVKYPSREARDEDAKRDLVAQGFEETMADAFIARLSNVKTVEK